MENNINIEFEKEDKICCESKCNNEKSSFSLLCKRSLVVLVSVIAGILLDKVIPINF